MPQPRQLVEHFFRHESARLVASLTRLFGVRHLGLVEDVVQASLLRALTSWSLRGVPNEPAAWLRRVAHRLAIDALRRDTRWSPLGGRDVERPGQVPSWEDVGDDQLRMIFVCCDDAVPAESQVALALKTLCGFGTEEIARALLTSEANVARRITRAKEKLREVGLDPGALTAGMIQDRLDAVLSVVYLLFNEGYGSTRADQLVREELCEEAVRLALVLAEHPLTEGPRTAAFVALLLFHASRLAGRVDDRGMLLLLEEQDRAAWDQGLIAEAFRWFARSAGGDRPSRYHAEAWIAAEHCRARRFADTDWGRIVQAYDLLFALAPSPVHELNRAIAVAGRDGAEAGWAALQAIRAERLADQYHLWSATAGELARRRGAWVEAREFLEQAAGLARTDAERRLLRRRLAELGGGRLALDAPGQQQADDGEP
ncbi:MAG: sigma-70 family RNA polymerase sigma factor [Gemmataceae bacterium]